MPSIFGTGKNFNKQGSKKCRPEARAPGQIIFSAPVPAPFARLADESAALPPLSDRAFHAVQERQVGIWPACACTGIARRISLRPGRAIPPVSAAQGTSSLSGQSCQTSIATLRAHEHSARCGCAVAASSIVQKDAGVVRRPRASPGAGLFRWRTQANEGIRTCGRADGYRAWQRLRDRSQQLTGCADVTVY